MADPTHTVQDLLSQIPLLGKEIQDLATKWDALAKKLSDQDLTKVMKVDKVSQDMQKFLHAVNGVTAAQQKQHKIEKELNRTYAKTREEILRLTRAKQELDDYGKQRQLTSLEKLRYKDLKEAIRDEAKKLQEINKLRDPKKLQELSEEYDDYEKHLKMVNLQNLLLKKGMEYLVKTFVNVYKWQDRLQKNLGTLAERFGTSTDALVNLAQVAKTEFLDTRGLGGMGFTLEEISSKLAEFRDKMEFVGKVSDKQAATLIRYGMAVGMSAQQVGEFSRAIVIMGGSAQDTADFLLDVGSAAKKAGVTSAALAKQFMGAGKALFELTGPKARRALTESAAVLARMGVGLDKLKGFTEMTDIFDRTAEAMAGLNTVFGTHLNALDVFAEQDPAKRWMKVVKAMTAAGMTPDMIRQEKKFLMDKLQISEEVANAGLRAAETGGDLTAELKKQADVEKERAETQKKFEATLERGKKVLIAWEQIATNFYDKFSGSGVIKPLKTLFDTIMNFVKSDSLGALVDGMTEAFSFVGDIVNLIMPAVSFVAKIVTGIVGSLLQGLGFVWKLIKYAAGAVGMNLGASAVSEKDLLDSSDKIKKGLVGTFEGAGTELMQDYGFMDKQVQPSVMKVPEDTVEAYADGGSMRKGQVAVVGEAGPELFQAPAAGNIINNQTTQELLEKAGGKEATIHVQVVLDGEIIQDRMYKSNLRRNS